MEKNKQLKSFLNVIFKRVISETRVYVEKIRIFMSYFKSIDNKLLIDI